jgi:hypothetical protein
MDIRPISVFVIGMHYCIGTILVCGLSKGCFLWLHARCIELAVLQQFLDHRGSK